MTLSDKERTLVQLLVKAALETKTYENSPLVPVLHTILRKLDGTYTRPKRYRLPLVTIRREYGISRDAMRNRQAALRALGDSPMQRRIQAGHQEEVGNEKAAELSGIVCRICGPVEKGQADPAFHPETYLR